MTSHIGAKDFAPNVDGSVDFKFNIFNSLNLIDP